MQKVTPVIKTRWSVKSTPNQTKRKTNKKTNDAFAEVLHVHMLKLISECN